MQCSNTVDPARSTEGEVRENVLVSVEGGVVDRDVVERAGAFVVRTGGRLTVLNVMPGGAFADRQRARAAVPGLSRFTRRHAGAERRRAAAHVADEALAGTPVTYDCVGVVGREPACILAEARARGCDRIVLATRRRASLGAVTAEEVVRSVSESFDGVVTVIEARGLGERVDETVA